MRDQKGITLVALVVTIIVLLILAGVTIALVLGQDGIVTKAENASKETFKSDVDSIVQLAMLKAKVDSYDNNTGVSTGTVEDTTYAAKVKESLTEAGYTVAESASPLTAKKSGLKVTVTIQDGKATVSEVSAAE